MPSTTIEIYLYFLSIFFLLWLTSKSKQETSPIIRVGANEKLNSSEEIKTLKSTVKSGILSVLPIAPFCHIWAKPLKGIQD